MLPPLFLSFFLPFSPSYLPRSLIIAMAEEEECPIVLMQDVPLPKYHSDPVRFVSESGVSQQEYEKIVWSRR